MIAAIEAKQVDEADKRVLASNVRYRFVIGSTTLN